MPIFNRRKYKFVFRTDSSSRIGSGHYKRCLALAQQMLETYDCEITFVSFLSDEDRREFLNSQRFNLISVSESFCDPNQFLKTLEEHSISPDAIVLDSYEIGIEWQRRIRSRGFWLLVMDDFGDDMEKRAGCDVYLNPSLFAESNTNFKLEEKAIRLELFGPRYALLRSEILKQGTESKHRISDSIESILVFFGMGKSRNYLETVLSGIKKSKLKDINIHVLTGSDGETEAASLRNAKIHFYRSPTNAPEIMASCQLAICSGGSVVWELLYFGVPACIFTIAENQTKMNLQLAQRNLNFYLGNIEDFDERILIQKINALCDHPALLAELKSRMAGVVDGLGTFRVCAQMFSPKFTMTPVLPSDCKQIFEWRNHERVRKASLDPRPLSFNQHEKWFSNAIDRSDFDIYKMVWDGNPLGVCTFESKEARSRISVYLRPELHGSGLGTRLIRLGAEELWSKRTEINEIIAEIVPNNISSIQSFKKAGFTESQSNYILKRVQ